MPPNCPMAGDHLSSPWMPRDNQGENRPSELSRDRRECWQATLHPAAQGRHVAENHPGAMCLGGQPQEGKLPAGTVPTLATQARTEEGDLCRRRLDPDRRLPHTARRHLLPRSRRRPLPSHLARKSGQSPGSSDRPTRVRLHHHSPNRGSGFCLDPDSRVPKASTAASIKVLSFGVRWRSPR